MQLIGMLDSPYVRRAAISLRLLGIPFEHRSISVFRTFEQFQAINPVVKAPSFICDDGEVLMDSTLIIDYAEALAAPGKSLMPSTPLGRQHALRRIGLALAACEKSVQIVYEHTQRPPEKRHEPWLERVRGQVLAAYAELERDLQQRPPLAEGRISQGDLTTACAWQFTQSLVADVVPAADFPTLQAFSTKAEQLPVFQEFYPD